MDVSHFASEIRAHKAAIDVLSKQIGEIGRLEKDRPGNLPQLKAHLGKLRDLLGNLERGAQVYNALHGWVDRYERELDETEEALKKGFGVQLEESLRPQGLSLLGQYPDFKAGLFTIETDFGAHKAIIWYGPKQERLGHCGLSVRDVASLIEKAGRQLGCNLDGRQFLARLHDAYSRAAGAHTGAPAPIIDVLAELAYLVQDARFHEDPKREHYTSYGRADFGHDLFRIRRAGLSQASGRRLHLVVATREHTRRRRDFLWVPDDETGRGTTYSHLQFKEEAS